jgi:predicted esterase
MHCCIRKTDNSMIGVAVAMMVQNEMLDARYRMGRRVRRMELLLEPKRNDVSVLRSVSAALQPAVMQFFSGNFQGVLRNVDAAHLSLVNAPPDGPLARLLALDVTYPKLLDSSERQFVAKIDVAYGSKLANGEVRCRLKGMSDWQDATAELTLTTLQPSSAPVTPQRTIVELACGSARLDVDISALRIKDLKKRTGLWMKVSERDAQSSRSLARARILALIEGKSLENDPDLKMLWEIANGQTDEPDGRVGDYLAMLGASGQKVPCRLQRGSDSKGKQPLVIALHGAGGSENMFFDTYGAGKITALCAKRGWHLVSPRVSGRFPAQLLESLSKVWNIDSSRVFIVGHSMGAAAASSGVDSGAIQPAAVALLGGGGAVTSPARWKDLPLMIGVGELDFGKMMASRTRPAAERAGSRLTYKEYAGVEHLSIVQCALDDVFTWLDKVSIYVKPA